MDIKRKKVLFHSNYCGAATGFGGFMKELLTYLQKTGKYDLYLYASGVNWENPDFQRWPWKVFGTVPNNQQEIEFFLAQGKPEERDMRLRAMSYGLLNIDKVIYTVKPDIYIAVEDFWAQNYSIDKEWWNKINCVINWTSDSLPLLDEALEKAPKIKHHYVWAEFAVKEFQRLADIEERKNGNKEKIEAFRRVKSLRGTVDTNSYKRLSDKERLELKLKQNISPNDFLIGALSRNQLRKLWINLLEGYKLFKNSNPTIKNTKLLFFTSYQEGWNIPKAIKELDLDNNEILCCYKCRVTGEYFVRPFIGENVDNPKIPEKGSLVTVNLSDSLPSSQVNEWYNLLNLFCLPITSGGQERAAQEAKLCELITLINPYSCGEDNCVPEAYSLPLDFATYREIQTQFIKASPYPSSIAKQIKKAYEMSEKQRKEWGQGARKWVLENFSIEIIGRKYEELIDSIPDHNWDFIIKQDVKNINAQITPEIFNLDDDKFIFESYKTILNMDVTNDKIGPAHWKAFINQPGDKNKLKEQMLVHFRQAGVEHNSKVIPPTPFESLLLNNGKKNFLLVAKESAGDIIYISCLFKSFRESYPPETWNVYFACDPAFNELLDGCPYIDKILPYQPFMESEIQCIGQGTNKGLFQGYSFIPVSTQRHLNYLSNHNIKLNLQ